MKEFGFQNYQLNDKNYFADKKITISENILQGYMLSEKL
jgi:hypothetical protein